MDQCPFTQGEMKKEIRKSVDMTNWGGNKGHQSKKTQNRAKGGSTTCEEKKFGSTDEGESLMEGTKKPSSIE